MPIWIMQTAVTLTLGDTYSYVLQRLHFTTIFATYESAMTLEIHFIPGKPQCRVRAEESQLPRDFLH